MLSSSIYGSQKATFLKICIFEKYNTLVRLVLTLNEPATTGHIVDRVEVELDFTTDQ